MSNDGVASNHLAWRRWALGSCLGAALSWGPCAGAAAPSGESSAFAAPWGSPAAAVSASNAFGFALYARLRAGHANVICSPLGAATALTMAWAGARGVTQREMAGVLALRSPHPGAIHRSFAALLRTLDERSGDDVTLHVTDRLWGQRGLDFRPDYLRLLDQVYGAPLESVDFANATEQARAAINRWAARETHDRVPAILQPGDLASDTRLVLTNAVYLKAAWTVRFSKGRTADGAFTTPAGGKVTVPLMHEDQIVHRYARVRGAQLLELTYQGGLSMVIVLPDQPNGLDAIERRLAASYQAWLNALGDQLVDLALPRWTVRSRLPLTDILAAMGMASAFSVAADFSGTATARPLFIQKVLQEAFVNVDEEGTEAAAVTAIAEGTIGEGRSLVRPIPFHADHPFLYLIRDQKTGAVLFIGRVVDPR